MKQSKAEMIVARLLVNAAEVRFGNVSVSLKMHNGKVVEVTYITAEQDKEPKEFFEKDD